MHLIPLFAFNPYRELYSNCTFWIDKMIQHLSENQLHFYDTIVLSPLQFNRYSNTQLAREIFQYNSFLMDMFLWQQSNCRRQSDVEFHSLLFRLQIYSILIVDTNGNGNDDGVKQHIYFDVCKSFHINNGKI